MAIINSMGSSLSSINSNLTQTSKNIVWIGASAAISLAVILNYLHSKDNKVVKWKKVGRVDQLFLYPLKSGKGIKVHSAQFKKAEIQSGLLRDRTFVIVNNSNDNVRAYQNPAISLLQVVDQSGHLYLRAPGKEDLRIREEDLEYSPDKEIQVKFGGVEGTFTFISVGEKYDRFLSEYFKSQTCDFRLVYYCNRSPGLLNCWSDMIHPSKNSNFKYTSDVSLMNLASWEDLNSRLEKEFKLERFRQNIIVKTDRGEAFEEDAWQGRFKIGKTVELHFNEACERCLVTTIDPDTGEKHAKNEPLRTLRKFRQLEVMVKVNEVHRHKVTGMPPLFGLMLSVDVEGTVNVGDDVYVEDLE